jgi:hypothetical protein
MQTNHLFGFFAIARVGNSEIEPTLAQLLLRFICRQITLNDITPLVMLIDDSSATSNVGSLHRVCDV